MNTEKESTPDFLVHWRNKNKELVSSIQCQGAPHPISELGFDEPQLPRTVFQTSKVVVSVGSVRWTTPTTIAMTHNRPGVCLLHSKTPNMSITFGYDESSEEFAREGQVSLFLPGKNIFSRCSEGAFRSVMCSFDPDYAESIFIKTFGSIDNISDTQWNSALNVRSSLVSSILLRLMQEVLQPSAICESVVEAFGHTLLLECAHWLTSRRSSHDVDGKLSARHFAIIDEYLAVSAGRIPRVAEIAGACGFSERYFAKLFREQTGITVAQYIKYSQIAKAKKFLLETDLTLQQISYHLGFSSQSNFSSAFKSVVGMAPGNYRQAS